MGLEMETRDEILEHATRTKQLCHDPTSFITELLVQQQQVACIKFLFHFNVPLAVPECGGAISYRDLARTTNLPQGTLKSVSRMAITAGFLEETSDGRLRHSSLSKAIVENPHLTHWLVYSLEQTVPMMNCLIPAVEKWGDSMESNNTAYNILKGTDLPFFQFLKTQPDLSAKFDALMTSQNIVHSGTRINHLIQAFDWEALGSGVVVDVGGNSGATCIAIAKAFPALRFIVQDLRGPIETARSNFSELPGDLSARIELQEHDFFTPQPVKGAAVYLLRLILHDWKDADAIRILNQLAEAAGPESRILVMDMVLPTPGTGSRTAEAALRQKDLAMLEAFNAKERETEDWRALISQVDPYLEIKAITRPAGSQHSVIEVVSGKVVNGVVP